MSQSSINFTKQALDDVRRAERVFEFVSGGSRKEIKLLKRELEQDPKRNMRDRNDPQHMINKCSRNG